MHTVYGVALPKVYILVHFWQRVSARLKLAADITSGIHAATANPQRIRTAKEGSGFKQKQVCSYKLVAQK